MPRGILPVLARRVPSAPQTLPRISPFRSRGAVYVRRPWLAQDIPRSSLRSLAPARFARSSTRSLTPSSTQCDDSQRRTGYPGVGPFVALHRTQSHLNATFPPASSILSKPLPVAALPPAHLSQRHIHIGRRTRTIGIRRAHRSSRPPPPPQKPTDEQQQPANDPQPATAPRKPEVTDHSPTDPESITSSVSKYFHIPHIPRRPTKEELLAATDGFLQRLKVRFKWFSIRSMRPWNADEWGAFVSWFILSHLVWILVGTTTFFSLLIFSINTVFAQETLAQWIGDYLTQSAGVTVVFESAIVPKWKDGVIALRKVHVSRRPGQVRSSVSKGSSALAPVSMSEDEDDDVEVVEDDGNYTQFDLTIETVNVTLSFAKWWNGKGLLKDVEIKGVRGEVDRRSVVWLDDGRSPLSYRHEHVPGDFEIENFKLDDLHVTVHQPEGFRPFEACIYSCELPQLRKQWLFYDILSANNMSGSYDGSLFTIHTPLVDNALGSVNQNTFGNPKAWKKSTRLRIDNLKIDHLNRGVDGPFGWIYEGKVDIMADVMLPADEGEGLGKVVSDFYDQLDDLVTSNRIRLLHNVGVGGDADEDQDEGLTSNSHGAHIPQELLPEQDQAREHAADQDRRYLVFDLRIRLNDVKAAVPLLGNDISYINQALVRPIVAYINSRRTYIPVTCRFAKRRDDFDGSWSVFDSGLMDDLSAETYSAFALNVEDQQNRVRRLKKVGGWTLSLLIHAIAGGMAGTFA
ncbi:related to MDM31 - Mitochondrial Distribution and Morphology [Cephalotrichum gorgonifer]|uniref:Related to MDM31 - Mitochondrial Distribution and Morphology n=1 Tax=Cephalotrichum gorgonifer TaxID=2041049 RepID=A0AAE8MP91_9PEZI|nr:related to MDM31 - Mitochondrial Distribution and Morphology [Cephalotrichum gorgonifer]